MMPQLLAHLFGDYLLQSDWMAQNKTKRGWPALVHALLYSLCFLWLCRVPVDYSGWSFVPVGNQRWTPWLVIFGTHFLIDRYRLARYVVWAKNWLGAPKVWIRTKAEHRAEFGDNWHGNSSVYTTLYQEPVRRINAPLSACKRHGYADDSEPWMSIWLLIIADNTLHLAINYAALRWL